MVNLPVVTLLFSAKECSFCTASRWETDAANLTLALVYSCPGCHNMSIDGLLCWLKTYINYSVIRQRRKALVQSLMHLLRIALEESSTSCSLSAQAQNILVRIRGLLKLTANEKGITGKNSFVLSVFHKEADAVLSVARCMHTLEGDVA